MRVPRGVAMREGGGEDVGSNAGVSHRDQVCLYVGETSALGRREIVIWFTGLFHYAVLDR